jgi:hypothetical protein
MNDQTSAYSRMYLQPLSAIVDYHPYLLLVSFLFLLPAARLFSIS